MRKIRGQVTDKAIEMFQKFYSKNKLLSSDEIKLYPYMDYCLKNGINLEEHKLTGQELALLSDLMI